MLKEQYKTKVRLTHDERINSSIYESKTEVFFVTCHLLWTYITDVRNGFLNFGFADKKTSVGFISHKHYITVCNVELDHENNSVIKQTLELWL